ncbi:MAG: hypothetical protein AMXMBFR78_08950 [Rubrivivax sp.]|jgi:negative regulator of flagellin synthesis FlgM
MKILPFEKTLPVKPSTPERKAPGNAQAPAGQPTDGSAKVAISPEAAALAATPPGEGSFDAAKVERVSRAIKDGSYKVDAEAIADKLIANAKELLGRTYR